MKKILLPLICIMLLLTFTGCGTESENEEGEKTRDFKVGEVATINKDTTIKINEVKKILKECSWEYNGSCQSWNEPESDYFILIDLTIENKGSEDLSISSIMSFDLKDASGEKGKYAFLTNTIKSQLDGTVMPGDLLKGQIAYDVKESDTYNFYFTNSLLSSPIKFVINKSDITE